VFAAISRVAMIGKPRSPYAWRRDRKRCLLRDRGNHIGDRGNAPWLVNDLENCASHARHVPDQTVKRGR